jgi:DNA-binding response OmpR family regulator
MLGINIALIRQILVVDRAEDSRELTEAAMLSAGRPEVFSVGSALEAFEVLDLGLNPDKIAKVDLILLDIVTPEIDGVEACRRLRSGPRYAECSIIMVTSLDDVESLSNAFVAGAADDVTKPVHRVELVARVRAALKLEAELDRRQARAAAPKLRLPNPKSIVSDHFIASGAAITGPRGREIDRVHLLTRAISGVQDIAATGGNRALALSAEGAEAAQNPAFPPYPSQ